MLEDLAVKPEHAEKHGAQHVELILSEKYPKPVLKTIQVAARTKKGCVREKVNCAIRLPSQILSELYHDTTHVEPTGNDPSILSLYPNHPIVLKGIDRGIHWSRILPIALYTDGVKYTTRDSFIAFYITDYRTQQMSLVSFSRKADCCNCGCRGWCTLYPILLEIALDFGYGSVPGFFGCMLHDQRGLACIHGDRCSTTMFFVGEKRLFVLIGLCRKRNNKYRSKKLKQR